jgi:hypothetical protein
VPVTLKINANGIDDYHQHQIGIHDYHQHQNNVVTIQVWPFEQIMQEYLLDPFLFGNESNLVNAGNPWGKYISSDPDDKEMLASYIRKAIYGIKITLF